MHMSKLLVRARSENAPGAVIDLLREAILNGRYSPGERLVQDELAATFGTSRIPLREALQRLEGEGLVMSAPHRGAFVRPLAPKDVADLYDVRLSLESLAVRRSAERYADLSQTIALNTPLAAEAIDSGDLSTLFHIDRDFHAELAMQSANPHLEASLGALWSQIMRAMHAFFRVATYPADVWVDHAAIARAVALGDADGAEEFLRRHVTESRDRILAYLREH
jgi:DNA-binding GntR family transcriptional regulator